MNTPTRLVLGFPLLTAVLAVSAPGQIVSPGIPMPNNPWTSPLAPKQMPGLVPIYKSGFQGLDAVLPEFQGFPTFPPNAAGYGGFPLPPASLVALPEIHAGRQNRWRRDILGLAHAPGAVPRRTPLCENHG